MAVEFRLLGEIEAHVDGHPIAVGYAQLRGVLAVLLVEANRRVPVGVLIDRIWGDRRLPARPRGAVQQSITLLRRALVAAPEVSITWSSGGYQLNVDPETVDVHRFWDRINRARAAADGAVTADLCTEALRLWRGEPFAGLDMRWFNATRSMLNQQRKSIQLDLIDALLQRGQHATVLSELHDLVDRHPLDERLAGQYMLALYRNGCQAEALERFGHVRACLGEQLGADPSPPLQQLHRQILNGDQALVYHEVNAAVGTQPRVVPRQLPAGPHLFIGRGREVARLAAMLDRSAEPGGSAPIAIIAGGGGVGKTWLALHAAHRRLAQFTDGQLHVNLRGFDPAGQPVAPATAVRGFLDALGVSPGAVPLDLDAQTALYRSLVADKRMLIVLDNARDAAQVTPLLPGGRTCAVLITSRNPLNSLIATHGGQYLDLDVLTNHESASLLTEHLGRHCTAAEPDAVAELVACCAGLPLALSVVAARATTRPRLSLATLADEVRNHTDRLDALDGGDPATSLRAVLSSSYLELSDEARRVLELLGLTPGADVDRHAVAGLASLPTADARMVLRRLEEAFLVQQHVPGRYRMHDLVRLYAEEQANRHLPSHLRVAALRRLLDFYLHTAFSADRLIDPIRPPIELPEPPPDCCPQTFDGAATALAWFATEHANLLACQQVAVDHGWHAMVWQLAWSTGAFQYRRGHPHDAHRMWRAGLTAADHIGDPVAQILARQRLGQACGLLELLDEAIRHVEHSLELAGQTGDTRSAAFSHHDLAWMWDEQNDLTQALHNATQALRLFKSIDDQTWTATSLNTTGWCHAKLGHYDEARKHCEEALALLTASPHAEGRACTRDSLGYIAHQTGQYALAREHYQEALSQYRELDHTYGEASTSKKLGDTLEALGRHHDARTTWQHALALYQAQHRMHDAGRVEERLASTRSD
jgi:DNA-binding SARP family transcriptional activator/Tfp pilus assembly protein PilF